MQNKDHRYINTSQNLYPNHGYEYSTGNQHLPGEQYRSGSYPVPHNANPYGNNNMRGIPYEENHAPPVHGHFIPPQDNSFINHGSDMSNERKNPAANMNYENAYNLPPDRGSHHSPMVNMPSDNIHSPISSNVNMVPPSHQQPGVNMVQPPHQPNRQVHYPGQAPNSWGQYQELHPRVQNMHRHNQQPPHFHNVSPNHVQQYPHEARAQSSGNSFPPCNSAMQTNNYQFQSVHPVAERRNVANPLQSLQNMVMSDNSMANMQQNCQTPTVSGQCPIEYEKPASPYVNSDGYQAGLTQENKGGEQSGYYPQLPLPPDKTASGPVTPISNETPLTPVSNSQMPEQYVEQQSLCNSVPQMGEMAENASPGGLNAAASNHSNQSSELLSNPSVLDEEKEAEACAPKTASNVLGNDASGEGRGHTITCNSRL